MKTFGRKRGASVFLKKEICIWRLARKGPEIVIALHAGPHSECKKVGEAYSLFSKLIVTGNWRWVGGYDARQKIILRQTPPSGRGTQFGFEKNIERRG